MRIATNLLVSHALLLSAALLGCATRPLESHVQAWGMVDQTAAINEVRAENADVVAESPWGKPRVAVWLNPYDRAYYAGTPTAQAIAANHAVANYQEEPAQSAIVAGSDGRSPVGWNHSQLVENWGVPQRIVGSSWYYYSQDAQCEGRRTERRLTMVDGFVKGFDMKVSQPRSGC